MAGEKRRAAQFMGKNAIVAVIGQRFKLSKTKKNLSKRIYKETDA